MKTLDLKKDLKYLYAPSAKKVELVQAPAMQFAMIDGQIEPGAEPGTSTAFQEATQALYGISYTLKFASKRRKEDPVDYPVMALEGLWWVNQGEFNIQVKDAWSWTLMILQPAHISRAMYEAALDDLKKKKPSPGLERLRLETFEEGLCMQIMHIGPYTEEPRTIQMMMDFAAANGYRVGGRHHEIYLGDPRKAAPEKLKTILRYPLEKTG